MNAETKAALLPCPFCGGEAALLDAGPWPDGHYTWSPMCISGPCAVWNTYYDTKAEAIAAWNRRAHIASETSAYEAGKADAVAKVVAYLRQPVMGGDGWQSVSDAHADAADAIASGAHERNGDDAD
jgi:Lar family restriction alleviation protein